MGDVWPFKRKSERVRSPWPLRRSGAFVLFFVATFDLPNPDVLLVPPQNVVLHVAQRTSSHGFHISQKYFRSFPTLCPSPVLGATFLLASSTPHLQCPVLTPPATSKPSSYILTPFVVTLHLSLPTVISNRPNVHTHTPVWPARVWRPESSSAPRVISDCCETTQVVESYG